MKRYIYLISPQKIGGVEFYRELNKVLKTNKIKYFQLRLKKISNLNLLKISKKVKKITKKNNVKLIINDNPIVAKKVGAEGCHVGQKDINIIPGLISFPSIFIVYLNFFIAETGSNFLLFQT